jgi:hypothetical protein
MTEKNAPGTALAEVEKARQEELSIYERLLQMVGKRLQELKSAVDAETLGKIIDAAGAQLKAVGEYSAEAIGSVTRSLKKDLASSAEGLKPLLETIEKGAGQAVDSLQAAGGAVWTRMVEGTGGSATVWRDKAGSALASLLNGVSGWSASLGSGLDSALTYHTGEATYGGTFQCKHCGSLVHLKKPGHLPPCPKCHKTEFQRA